MVKIYLLWFVPQDDRDEENSLLIGVYASERDAKEAIDRLRTKPGFVDHPLGFQIHGRNLGEDSWTEGFIKTADSH
jgi:hypothetical protein